MIKKKSISLFSGIGAGDIGLDANGFETIVMVENNSFCRKVLKKRFPKAELHKDVREFSGLPWRGQVDLLSGGFPCTSVSSVGKQKGFKKDSKTASSLGWEVVRIADELQPKQILLENVANIMCEKFKEEREAIFEAFKKLGYGGKWIILSGWDCGASQIRDRFWLLLEKQENPEIKEHFILRAKPPKGLWSTMRSSGVGKYTLGRKNKKGNLKFRDHPIDQLTIKVMQFFGVSSDDILNPNKVKSFLDYGQTGAPLYPNREWLECFMGLPVGFLDLSVDKPRFLLNSDGTTKFPAPKDKEPYPWEPAYLKEHSKISPQEIRALGNLQIPEVAKRAYKILNEAL